MTKAKLNLLKQDYMQRLLKLQGLGDAECAHAYADDLLCDLLCELGLQDIVTEYDKVGNW